MAGLLLKDIPADTHHRLKLRAKAHRRSLSSEVLVLLEQALDDRVGPPTLSEIDSIRATGKKPLTQKIIDAARSEGRP